MLSVRLDNRLDTLTRKAAAMEGTTMSEFMRRAVAERAERTLSGGAGGRLADVIGAVHGGGAARARDSGTAFAELLAERHKRQ
ncbi:MAG TPA: DUF6290 family protein [Solirubrobacteraceae bacterium]|jgi:hypothetical protein|nr:DUF6290 family protein [Solirubrobacteraceae bacterium]